MGCGAGAQGFLRARQALYPLSCVQPVDTANVLVCSECRAVCIAVLSLTAARRLGTSAGGNLDSVPCSASLQRPLPSSDNQIQPQEGYLEEH